VAALGGKVYAAGGRTAGIDTNLAVVEVYAPATRRWTRLRPVPSPRGGTGLAAAPGRLFSVGGERPGGTIASVWVFDVATGRWQRLPDLPTPRHGLGVAVLDGRLYAVAGGKEPGLFVSGANEILDLGP
jgi:N-acetylneuraminic acid mutarotase